MPSDRKDPSKRQRRNHYAGQRQLPASGYDGPIPALPDRPSVERTTGKGEDAVTERVEQSWSALISNAWDDLWRTPMAVVWAENEVTSVLDLFRWACFSQDLLDDKFENTSAYNKAASEVRQIGDRYGFSPRARNNLGWVIVDDAAEDDQAGDDASRATSPATEDASHVDASTNGTAEDDDEAVDPRRLRVVPGGA